MSSPVLVFRALVLGSFVFAFLAVFIEWVQPCVPCDAFAEQNMPWIDSATRFLGPGVSFAMAAAIGIVSIVALIEYLRFRRWARSLVLWWTLLGFAAALTMSFFEGPEMLSSISLSFRDAIAMMWGAALALAYWSPLSTKFEG